jgi:hypothetical protein
MVLRDHGRVITRGPGGGLSAALIFFCGAKIVTRWRLAGPLPGPAGQKTALPDER